MTNLKKLIKTTREVKTAGTGVVVELFMFDLELLNRDLTIMKANILTLENGKETWEKFASHVKGQFPPADAKKGLTQDEWNVIHDTLSAASTAEEVTVAQLKDVDAITFVIQQVCWDEIAPFIATEKPSWDDCVMAMGTAFIHEPPPTAPPTPAPAAKTPPPATKPAVAPPVKAPPPAAKAPEAPKVTAEQLPAKVTEMPVAPVLLSNTPEGLVLEAYQNVTNRVIGQNVKIGNLVKGALEIFEDNNEMLKDLNTLNTGLQATYAQLEAGEEEEEGETTEAEKVEATM